MLSLFCTPRREGRWALCLDPFPDRPRDFFPVAVNPRSSRCFMTGRVIQLMRGSLRMVLCCGSTKITSKYLYVASWFTQYEFSTRRLPQRRPTRSSAFERRERSLHTGEK